MTKGADRRSEAVLTTIFRSVGWHWPEFPEFLFETQSSARSYRVDGRLCRTRPFPALHGPIGGGGGQPLAIGTERHTGDACGVSLERQELLTRARIPELDRLILAGGGEALAIGTERHTADPVRV